MDVYGQNLQDSWVTEKRNKVFTVSGDETLAQ